MLLKRLLARINLQTVAQYTTMGWPAESSQITHTLQKIHIARAHLSEVKRLLLYDDWIVIPFLMQKSVLSQIHEGHEGLTKYRRRANMSVWWPELGRDVMEMVKT